MKTSALEHGFLTYWKVLAKGYPEPVREYQFAPPHKYRFDFAWVTGINLRHNWKGFPVKLGVELEGGVWTNGRHVRGKGFLNDCDKYNLATALDWKVFRFTADHFKNTPSRPIKMVCEALAAKE